MMFTRVNSLEEGFTLVELLIVIAILAILSSLSIIAYQKYRQKSFVTARALPIVDGCSKEIIAYCIDLNVDSPTTIDVSSVSLSNCKNVSLPDYNLNINVTGSFTCNPGGSVSGGTVEAIIDNIADYKAKCILTDEGINCFVVER